MAEIDQNLLTIKAKILALTSPYKLKKINVTAKGLVPEIMAHLFSIWTLQDTSKCY